MRPDSAEFGTRPRTVRVGTSPSLVAPDLPFSAVWAENRGDRNGLPRRSVVIQALVGTKNERDRAGVRVCTATRLHAALIGHSRSWASMPERNRDRRSRAGSLGMVLIAGAARVRSQEPTSGAGNNRAQAREIAHAAHTCRSFSRAAHCVLAPPNVEFSPCASARYGADCGRCLTSFARRTRNVRCVVLGWLLSRTRTEASPWGVARCCHRGLGRS
jgi:hypothetical protein